MSGFAGWHQTSPVDAPKATIQTMIGSIPARRDTFFFDTKTTAGAAAKACSKAACYSVNTACTVLLDGEPRWSDSEFSTVAAEQGAAAAVALAWRRDKHKMLQMMNGAFAMVIVDQEHNSVFLAVDRMGIRPLAFACPQTGGIVFASTATAVNNHPESNTSVDPQAVFDYVCLHVVPSPGTVFMDIQKLPPAHYVQWRPGQPQEMACYWKPQFAPSTRSTEAELSAQLMTQMRKAIGRAATTTDTAAFLSGGLDSSTVLGLLAERTPEPPRAYSIGFAADGYDEMHYARVAANHFGCPLQELYVQPADVVSAIPQVAAAYDEPFGNASAIPALYCARKAADDGTRVLLAGDGGDELFAGNERYVKQKIFGLYNELPSALRRSLIEPLFLASAVSRLPGLRKISSYVDQARIPMPDRLESYNFVRRETADAIFCDDFLAGVDQDHPYAGRRSVWAEANADSLVDQMLYLDWKITLADNDLRKVNRMCELAGIQVCYPLLDDELVAFSTRIPANMKLRGRKLRHFFRNSVRHFLPHETIQKSKHGFGLPFGEWLKIAPELRQLTYDTLYDLKHRKIIAPQYIDRLIALHRSDHAAYYGTMVWVLTMLEQWFQAHDVSV